MTNRAINREASWLEFNRRVLAEAADPRNPLLERLRFLNIFRSNLDEFFMKRVGGLKRQREAGVLPVNSATPAEQLAAIRTLVDSLQKDFFKTFKEGISPKLSEAGLQLMDWELLSPEDRAFVDQYFRENLYPVLTPLSVDPSHPFPFISGLSTSFGVLMRPPGADIELSSFARVKVPANFPIWLQLPGGEAGQIRFLSLYELIGRNMHQLFPGMGIDALMMFRVTRNYDIEKDADDADDLLEHVSEELRERRFAEVVRLEHGPNPHPQILKILTEELELSPEDIYELPNWLEFQYFSGVVEQNLPVHSFPPVIPQLPAPLNDPEIPIFDQIRNQDILVHHPFESFHGSVERFVASAVQDPHVIAIKMTLYRTGDGSPFIPLLIQAAESGKQVACLVELKARMDEERNIQVARTLEKAGVHVVYGVVGLKTHCKLTLVVRQEGAMVRSYVHIGTGNYHAKTARLYTDVGLFTAKKEYAEDVVNLFHYLTGRSLTWNFKKLLVAPIDMRNSFLRMVEREIAHAQNGKPARILIKVNNLDDEEMSESLYKASQAGVKIDLIVRSICSLRPGVEGLSENIRVVSILGRFLEHSRIFYFANGSIEPMEGEFFIGSADWMHRNLNRRVEAVAPVEAVDLKKKLWDILSIYLHDERQSWLLKPDGRYERLGSAEMVLPGSHQILLEQAKSSQRFGLPL